ncbi:MAG: CpsB/CapC family capsule biosynthesis tyrosine phosphatase [Lachnospiraceae bacterium]
MLEEKNFERLQAELRDREIPVKLYSGMEIFMDEKAADLLDLGELLTLNGTRYVLVEFDFEEKCRKESYNYVADLQTRRYNIVLAHPERYLFVQRDPLSLHLLSRRNRAVQLPGKYKGSVLGQFGRRCRNLAEQFLDDGIVSVLASDAHDFEYRTPSMNRLVAYLERRYSKKLIRMWLSENPSRILNGMPILTT